MVVVTCLGNNLNGFNKFLNLEQILLLFDYDTSAMKSTLNSFKQGVTISHKLGLLFKKRKLLGALSQAKVLIFPETLHAVLVNTFESVCGNRFFL